MDSFGQVGGNAFLACLGGVSKELLLPLIKWIFNFFYARSQEKKEKLKREKIYREHHGIVSVKKFEDVAYREGLTIAEAPSPFEVKEWNEDGTPKTLKGAYTVDKDGTCRNKDGKAMSKEEIDKADDEEMKRYLKFANDAEKNGLFCSLGSTWTTDKDGNRIRGTKLLYTEDKKYTLGQVLQKYGTNLIGGQININGTQLTMEQADVITGEEASKRKENKQTALVNEHTIAMTSDIKKIASFKGEEWTKIFFEQLEKELGKEVSQTVGKKLADKAMEKAKNGEELSEDDIKEVVAEAQGKTVDKLSKDINDMVSDWKTLLINKPDVFIPLLQHNLAKLYGVPKEALASLNENSTFEDYKALLRKHVAKDGKITELYVDENSCFTIFTDKDNRLCVIPNKQVENSTVMNDDFVLGWASLYAEREGFANANDVYEDLKDIIGRNGVASFVEMKLNMAEKFLPILDDSVKNDLGKHGVAILTSKLAQDSNMDISIFKDCHNIYDVHKVADARDYGVDVHKLQENNVPIAKYPALTNMHCAVTGVSMENGTALAEVSSGAKDILEHCMGNSGKYTFYEIDALTNWMEEQILAGKVPEITLENAENFIEERRKVLFMEVNRELGIDSQMVKVSEINGEHIKSLNVRLAEASLELYDDLCEGEIQNVFETIEGIAEDVRLELLADGADENKINPLKNMFETMACQPNQDMFLVDGEKAVYVERSFVVENIKQNKELRDAQMFNEAFYTMKEDGTVYCHIALKDKLPNQLLDDKGNLSEAIMENVGKPYVEMIINEQSLPLYNISNIVKGEMNKNPNDVILTDTEGHLYVVRKLDKNQSRGSKSHSHGKSMSEMMAKKTGQSQDINPKGNMINKVNDFNQKRLSEAKKGRSKGGRE